jgi:hypothetical protein
MRKLLRKSKRAPGIMAGGFLWEEIKKWGESGERMESDGKRKGLDGLLNNSQALVFVLVPKLGIEPRWACTRGILSPLRLPVSPLRHGVDY